MAECRSTAGRENSQKGDGCLEMNQRESRLKAER